MISRHHASVDAGTPLTARERAILRLLADGYAPKEAAFALGMAHQTLKNHLSNAKVRLAARTTVRAVVLFLEATA